MPRTTKFKKSTSHKEKHCLSLYIKSLQLDRASHTPDEGGSSKQFCTILMFTWLLVQLWLRRQQTVMAVCDCLTNRQWQSATERLEIVSRHQTNVCFTTEATSAKLVGYRCRLEVRNETMADWQCFKTSWTTLKCYLRISLIKLSQKNVCHKQEYHLGLYMKGL